MRRYLETCGCNASSDVARPIEGGCGPSKQKKEPLQLNFIQIADNSGLFEYLTPLFTP